MNKNKPFNKDKQTKISFSKLMDLIGTTCDYKFCIVDENIDEELMELAAKHGIDLTGYKHVIETSGVQHAEKRHGTKSNDRTPLTLEDYLMVPYIIKNRDTIEISPAKTTIRSNTVILYKKKIGYHYVYVEEVRDGKHKSLAFKSLRKRKPENPSE